MLKTTLTIAGVLVLGQAVQLPAADAQSGYASPYHPGSPNGGAQYRPTTDFDGVAGLSPGGGLPAPVGEGTTQPRPSHPSGFVCCVSPEGRSSMPE
jgi:hypothetical protein